MNQSHPPVEIIILDNDSNDDVISNMSISDARIRFVHSDSNLGYAAGMNYAFKKLREKTEWTLFLTHEVRMSSDTINKLFSIDLGPPESPVLQIGPTLALLEEDKIWSHGGRITTTGGARHNDHVDSDSRIGWLDGACHLVRTGALVKPIFNDSFFLYWEDVELSLRLSEQGQIVCVDDAIAYQSTNTTPNYFMSRNRVRTWIIRRDAPKFISSLVYVCAQIVRDLLRGHFETAGTRLVGTIDGITGNFHPEHYFRGR
ncbi:GT2 family glycosyltransferase [Arthrobacter stackebrandtii]|uniref:GT2 family glycosyltransferase n=1 Tax=Arthrobacter stackebrandtii TaxID=272161 RepID=A0ABS4YSF1_9MICC|nr:GT2 family glycosyltransferase [Arthrobacter stackebrandtii]